MDSSMTKNEELLPSSSWVYLPEDILHHILDLPSLTISEFIRFGAVCKNWYHVFLQKKKSRKEFLPMILIPFRNTDKPLSDMVVFNVFENKYYTKYFKACQIPENGISCLSCSYDWWAIIGSDSRITLVNPSAKISNIYLPPIQEFEFLSEITKVVLSSNPSVREDDYIVAFMGNRILQFMKSGEKSWRVVSNQDVANRGEFDDILFYEDQLYVLCNGSSLVVLDYRFDDINPYQIVNVVNFHIGLIKVVESLKHGLLVIQRWKTNYFHVYMMNMAYPCNDYPWPTHVGQLIGTLDLGKDEAIFWDEENRNFRCILASKYLNCRPNSIYYVEYGKSPQETDHMRIFNVNSSTICNSIPLPSYPM